MAKTVALINMKGGVGKSTLTFNLAWAGTMTGKRVLVVDLDPQFNVSQYLMRPEAWRKYIESGGKTVYDAFEQYTPQLSNSGPGVLTPDELIYHTPDRWWVTSGGILDVMPARLELSWTLRHPTSKEHLLARLLARVATRYDLILIDCAPTESIFTVAAYLASDFVLVPVRPEFLSTVGLPLLDRSLREFRAQYGRRAPRVAGIVLNMVDTASGEYRRAKSDISHVAEKYGWPIFENHVVESESYRKGARYGTPIQHTDYARWPVRQGFDRVASEFFRRIGL